MQTDQCRYENPQEESWQRAKIDWVVAAVFVPGRSKSQCYSRWVILGSNIDPTTARSGRWTEDEDIKLKDAVESTVVRIEALPRWFRVERKDSGKRCKRVSDIDPTTATCWQNGQKTKDNALKYAVAEHGANWEAIATLVTGRSKPVL
jgi:hypothetical protein